MVQSVPKILFFFLIFLVFSCDKQQENISDVPVNFSIYLDDPLYRDLRTIGNAINVIGGHAGIIIYRLSEDEFLAYDRICPYENNTKCRINASNNNLFYTCSCCKTPYLIIDGTGQSRNDTTYSGTGLFLKQYRTFFDGVNKIRISN